MLSLRRSLPISRKTIHIPSLSTTFCGSTPGLNSVLSFSEISRTFYPSIYYTTGASRSDRKDSSTSTNSSPFRRWKKNDERSFVNPTEGLSSSSSSGNGSIPSSSSSSSFTSSGSSRSSFRNDRNRSVPQRRPSNTPSSEALPSSSTVTTSSTTTPFAFREPQTTKDVQKLTAFPPPRPRIKPIHHPGHPKGIGGVLQTLNPTDANIARELTKLTSVNDILQHHRQHMNDYDTVNLSTAVQKVLSVSGGVQPWKRDIVAAQEFQSLTAHTVTSLRQGIKTDADNYPKIVDLQKRISKGDHEAQKELSTLKQLQPPLQIRTVASTVYALSKVNACPPSLLHEIGYVLTKRDTSETDNLSSSVPSVTTKTNFLELKKASPIDISMIAYAYSRSNIRAPQLFNRIAKRIINDIDNYKEKELSSIALSYTSLQTASPFLFQKIAERLAARREQTDTVTPQVLANIITSLARSMDLDKKLPDRLSTPISSTVTSESTNETVQSHAQTTASTLHILSERVSRTARKHRVPIISPYAFTAQGLASTAWSYAHVFNASLSTIVQQPEQVQKLGSRIMNRLHERITELSTTQEIVDSVEKIEQIRKELSLVYSIQMVTGCHNSYAAPWTNRTAIDNEEAKQRTQRMEAVRAQEASTVRVIQDIGQAFMHPQTISTATGAQLAIMSRAQADVSLGLLARISLVTSLHQELTNTIETKKEQLHQLTESRTIINANTKEKQKLQTQIDLYQSMMEITLDEHQRLDSLIKLLNVQEIIATCARSVVRILDPASGGDNQSVRAEIAKEDVFRKDAKVKTVQKLTEDVKSEEAIENAVVLRRKSSLALRSPEAKQETSTIQNAWLRETEEELNDELTEATNLLRTLEDPANGEERPRIETEQPLVQTNRVQDNFQSLLSDISNPSSRNRPINGGTTSEASNEDESIPEGKDTNPLNKQLRYNPLRYSQSVALATPVSLFDCSQLCSAVADCLVDEPEFWAKIADRVIRGRLQPAEESKENVTLGNSTLPSTVSRTNTLSSNAKGPERKRLLDGIEDTIRDMRPYDAAVLAYSASCIAPDTYASRILQAIAMVFAEEDLMLQLNDRVKPPSSLGITTLKTKADYGTTIVSKPVHGSIHNVPSSGDTSKEEDNIALLEAQQNQHRKSMNDTLNENDNEKITKSNDPNAPLPSFDEEPTWRESEEEAIRRSRSFMKAPMKGVFKLRGDNTGNLGNPVVTYGEENTEIGNQEKLAVYQGTLNTWTSRLIHRSKVDTQFKLFTAYALVLPPIGKPVRPPVDTADVRAWLQYYSTALRAESGKHVLHQLLPVSWKYYSHLHTWNKRYGTGTKAKSNNSKALYIHRMVQTTLTKGRIFTRGIQIKEPQFFHSSGFDSLLAWRHLMSELSSRISDRTRELTLTETGLFTLLLTTRSAERIENLTDLSWAPVLRGARPINEAPLRRIARRIVEDTDTQKSFVTEAAPSIETKNSSTDNKRTIVNQDFTSFIQLTRSFGFALRDSLQNHDEIFEKTLIQNQNILRSLILFLDESAKYLELVNASSKDRFTDTLFTIDTVTKRKILVSSFHWSIELATALSHIIIAPSAAERLPSSLSPNLQQQIHSVRSIAARWVKAIIQQIETVSSIASVKTDMENILSHDEETSIRIKQIMRMKSLVLPAAKTPGTIVPGMHTLRIKNVNEEREN